MTPSATPIVVSFLIYATAVDLTSARQDASPADVRFGTLRTQGHIDLVAADSRADVDDSIHLDDHCR